MGPSLQELQRIGGNSKGDIMTYSLLSTQYETKQHAQWNSSYMEKELAEMLIFSTREKIINHRLCDVFFNTISTLPSSQLTAKHIGYKLKTKVKNLEQAYQKASLTLRQEQFREYLTDQVMKTLKAPMPPHVRREILDAMSPFDRLMIKFIATKPACELLDLLDYKNSQIVNDLLYGTG